MVVYTPGAKGGPGACKLFGYPDFGENHALAHKTFFQGNIIIIFLRLAIEFNPKWDLI